MTVRQQVLYLWLSESALDSEVIAWAFHDGTQGRQGGIPDGDPPYKTGLAALEEGWLLLQSPQITPPPPGREFDPGYLPYEFVFERHWELPAA